MTLSAHLDAKEKLLYCRLNEKKFNNKKRKKKREIERERGSEAFFYDFVILQTLSIGK